MTGFTNPYQYTGREADSPGLYYYRARYYSPMIGGFISEDPLTFGGGQLSFYAYVGSDPLGRIDPYGLTPEDSYKTINEAGLAALTDILGTSVIQNQEYAGVIYQNWDGTYSYTAPNPGGEDTSDTGYAPLFHKEVGDYHTHGGDDEGGLAECFSDQDIDTNNAKQEPGFLGTPDLAIKRYDPNPNGIPWMGTVTVLQKGVSQ